MWKFFQGKKCSSKAVPVLKGNTYSFASGPIK
jgi:hypothetical protein